MTDQIHPLDRAGWEPYPEDIIAGALLWTPRAFLIELEHAVQAHAIYAGYNADAAAGRIASGLTAAILQAHGLASNEGAAPGNTAKAIMHLNNSAWIPTLHAAHKALGLPRPMLYAAAARHDLRVQAEKETAQ